MGFMRLGRVSLIVCGLEHAGVVTVAGIYGLKLVSCGLGKAIMLNILTLLE